MKIDMTLREGFPFIRQILADTFHIDAWYFSAPYRDLDKIDRGFRHMVMPGKDLYASLSHAGEMSHERHIVVIKSSLDFYNIMAIITLENSPDLISLGPFRDREMTEADLNHIIQSNRLPAEYMSVIRRFYYSLPVADIQSLSTTFRHLLAAFRPEYSRIAPEYINFSEEDRAVVPDEESMSSFGFREAETYSTLLEDFIRAVTGGDSETAGDKLKHLLDYIGYSSSIAPGTMKKILDYINSFCCSRLLMTQIHPVFILRCETTLEKKIENAKEYQRLLAMPYEICRKYCLLVRNYSYSDYSYLIRNVMNYITLHIAEDLSLLPLPTIFTKIPPISPGSSTGRPGRISPFISKKKGCRQRSGTSTPQTCLWRKSPEMSASMTSVIFPEYSKSISAVHPASTRRWSILRHPRPSEVKPPTVSSASAAGRNSSGRRSG